MALSPTSSHGGTSGTSSTKLYDYEVTGVDKATIDTFVDAPTVASFAGYSTLEVFIYSRTDEAAASSSALVTLNNDATNLYFQQQVSGSNVTAASSQSLTRANWALSSFGATAEASFFGLIAITIPNYLGTVGYKSAVCVTGRNDATAGDNLVLGYALTYKSAGAVTRLAVAAGGAGSPKLKVGTRLLIYGR